MEPRWVAWVLKYLPVPIYAFAVLATVVTIAAISAIFANMERSPIGWMISGMFAAIALLLASASLIRFSCHWQVNTHVLTRYADSQRKPTFVILVLLVSSYTWMFTIALHVFDLFFAANCLGGVKYFLTLGIALASTLYLTFHGRFVMRRFLGQRDGLNLTVSPLQAILVVVFTIAFSMYCLWVLL